MYEVGLHSDLFEVGITEDGEAAVSECFRVMLEAPDGSRWCHRKSFPGSEAQIDEEGISFFPDNRQSAMERAGALIKRIEDHLKSGGKIDFQHWIESDPAYGSVAYQQMDNAGHFKDIERMRDI